MKICSVNNFRTVNPYIKMFPPTGVPVHVCRNIKILNLGNEKKKIFINKAINLRSHQVNSIFKISSLKTQEHTGSLLTNGSK